VLLVVEVDGHILLELKKFCCYMWVVRYMANMHKNQVQFSFAWKPSTQVRFDLLRNFSDVNLQCSTPNF